MKKFGRLIAAIVVAAIVGEIVAPPIAVLIDIIAGAEVTGGRWSVNLGNIVLLSLKGWIVGAVAGSIARRRGILVGALAVFLPLEVLMTTEVIMNRDMSDYMATHYDRHPSFSVWTSLFPAMLGGYFAAKASKGPVTCPPRVNDSP